MTALVRLESGTYKARRVIPKDIRPAYMRLFGPAWEAKLTLPAALSAAEAKRRYADWDNEIDGRIKALRAKARGEVQSLTRRQAVALAGEWYVWFIGTREDAPGSPETWRAAFDEFTDLLWQIAPSSDDDLVKALEYPSVRAELRPLVAGWTDAEVFLTGKGMVLNPEGQALFLDAVTDLYADTVLLLERRAKGDYAPDTTPQRFPAFTRAAKGIGPWQLFTQWVKEAKPATSTVDRWGNVFRTMQDHFKDRPIPEDSARDWLKSLITSERSAITVRDIWLSASKTVFSWAREQKLVESNPFKAVKLVVPRTTQLRETKALMPEEIRTILSAAKAMEPKTTFQDAQRWVVWIMAYGGQRAGEVTQLRGQDFEQRGDIWVMKLSPDAGSIKNRKARMVPLHSDLVAQGFVEWMKTKGQGPLFYNPSSQKDDETSNPARPRAVKVRERLAHWIRGLGINDPELSPLHAWRHTFKLIAARAEMREQVVDAICGHAPATVGRSYGQPTVEDCARELKKFPRYEIC
jgi:integrase